jgi:methyl-accepting chemotaxis protein
MAMFLTFGVLQNFMSLGAWTTHLITPLFYFFKDDNVAPALASITFLAAIVLCCLFLLHTLYIRGQIGLRIGLIRRIRSKADFAEAMPKIEKRMLRCRYLRHSWEKFRETLIEPSLTDLPGQQLVRNTARPQDYFNTVDAGLRFPIFRAMPNVLVGIGLLLTFFGLVTALYFTTDAINNASDLTASQNALKDLLHAASFKFYTSIAGLAGSIILTIALRYGTAKLESSFDGLASVLEAKVVFVTPESIAFDHYREAQEHTKTLRLFNTEVALSIGRRIEEALAATLPGYLAQAMAPIGRSLEEVAEKITSMNQGAIGDLTESFITKLHGATGDQMQSLARTLGDLHSSIEELNQRMNESGSGLAENVSRSTNDMRDAIAAVTTALTEISIKAERGLDDSRDAINSQLETAIASLENASKQISAGLSQTIDRITVGSEHAASHVAQEMSAAAQNLKIASESIADRIEQAVTSITSRVTNNSAAIAEKIKDAALEASAQSTTGVAKAGAEVAETLARVGEQFSGALGRVQHSLDGMVQQMTSIERGVGDHVGKIQLLSKAAQETQNAMACTAQSLREAGAPLTESSHLIVEASRRIADATSSAERSITGANSQIRTISETLQDALRTTVAQWQDYEGRFKDVDENLGLILDRIVKSVQEHLEAMRGFVEKVDEKLAGAVDRLGGGIDELGEFAQTMEQVTARFNGGDSGFPRRPAARQ